MRGRILATDDVCAGQANLARVELVARLGPSRLFLTLTWLLRCHERSFAGACTTQETTPTLS